MAKGHSADCYCVFSTLCYIKDDYTFVVREEAHMSVIKIDFHDIGPPQSNSVQKFIDLVKQVGEITYNLNTDHLAQVDLETNLSEMELQCFIVDNFQFTGSISINGEMKIFQEEHHHGNACNTGMATAS